MGNLCRYRNGGAIANDDEQHTKDIQEIFDFDWNQSNSNLLTVEETIMRQLTNDMGQMVTPHTAHIIFTEFKKFMFLNKIYLDELKRKEEAESMKRQIKDYKSSYTGLVAPPLVDSLWIILMSLNTTGSK